MGEGGAKRRALGLVLDIVVLSVAVGVAYAAVTPRDRYFDIRGANMVGIAATYHSSASRGYAVELEVEGAWYSGGSFKAIGRVVYADSKRLVLFDPQRGVLVLSDEFDRPYVNGVPSRILMRIEQPSGVVRIDALVPSETIGPDSLESLCTILERFEGVEACLVSATVGVWMEESNVTIPASLIQDVAAGQGGIIEVETAGNEILVKMRFVPAEDSSTLLRRIVEILEREGVAVKGLISGPIQLTVLTDPVRVDADAVGGSLREIGGERIRVRREG
ncbi:MAG: hypothetical protein QI223_07265 [Candidatus Korarchaeota archaeon]|nr:hypothetical protein [Candidatus Korarchaeota archaeon]